MVCAVQNAARANRVRIIGGDTVFTAVPNPITSVDQIEFADNGAIGDATVSLTGGFNLALNSGANSLNQIYVSGTRCCRRSSTSRPCRGRQLPDQQSEQFAAAGLDDLIASIVEQVERQRPIFRWSGTSSTKARWGRRA